MTARKPRAGAVEPESRPAPHELELIENNGRRWCKVCGVEVL
jgi:hypothetical protein